MSRSTDLSINFHFIGDEIRCRCCEIVPGILPSRSVAFRQNRNSVAFQPRPHSFPRPTECEAHNKLTCSVFASLIFFFQAVHRVLLVVTRTPSEPVTPLVCHQRFCALNIKLTQQTDSLVFCCQNNFFGSRIIFLLLPICSSN